MMKRNQGTKGTMNTVLPDEDRVLFQKWFAYRDEEAGNRLIEKYKPLVFIIVEKLRRTLPKTVNREELISLGLIGLYEALEKFEPERKLKFETYASFRIRGAILDGLRKEDWLPRKTREKAKQLEMLVADLEQKFMRNVTVDEIARESGIPRDEISELLEAGVSSHLLSIDTSPADGEEEPGSYSLKDSGVKTPEEEVLNEERIRELAEAIQKLSKKEQLVLDLIYREELTLTEIGQMLELSTSRISQIHSKAVKKLRHLLPG